jgi:hypothetical protein
MIFILSFKAVTVQTISSPAFRSSNWTIASGTVARKDMELGLATVTFVVNSPTYLKRALLYINLPTYR